MNQGTVGSGAPFSLSATVRNRGAGKGAVTTLRWYRSSDSTIAANDTVIGTHSVSALAAGANAPASIGLTAPGASGTYYYGACVDPVTDEADTTNNCSTSVQVTVSAPDLVVAAPSVTDSHPTAGTSFTLSASVRNDGNGDAPATTLRYYLSTDAAITTDDTGVGTSAVAALAPSEISSGSVDLTAPAAHGTYYYGACVDPVTDETNTTNNCSTSVQVTVSAATPPPQDDPDLVVAPPSVTDSHPTAGTSFTLSASVRNDGNGAAPATTLRYYRSTDAVITTDDTGVGTSAVAALAPSEISSGSVDLTAPAAHGTYYYGACVDPVTDETNTTNNCSTSVQVTVSAATPPPQDDPDLVVAPPSVTDSHPNAGTSFTLSASVRNDGNGAAPATTLRYYLSADAVITTDDTGVGTSAVAALAPSEISSGSVDLTAPAAPRTYYYGACVDPVTDEADTTNNCSTSVQVQVTVSAPDLVAAAPLVTDSHPNAGTSFTLSASVHNDGNGDAPATTLRYYLSTDAAITTDDTGVGTSAVAALAPSEISSGSVNLTAPAAHGTYYYGACVDPVTDEANTTNNCSTAAQVEVVLPLSFQGTVADQAYPTGQAIAPLVLPAAAGGRGSLTYSLRPDIPGLSFNPAQFTLSGTPTEPGAHLMSYTVTDGKDSASSAFTITIEPTGRYFRYRGSGDQVFRLNPDGAMLDAEPYTLILGNASIEVYLIATNTAPYHMDPHIERLGFTEAAAVGRRSAGQDGYVPPPRPAPSAHVPELEWITEFNNDPPLSGRAAPRRGARLHPQSHRRGVAEGDRFTFRDLDDNQNLVFIPATARSVVTDGDTTTALWVADRDWGPHCRGAGPCLTGEMVDALADRFLRPGASNDIHDWVTAIYGDPWGPHPYSDIIPPSAASEIHILLFDIQGDGAPGPGECRIVGFFWAVHNFPQGHPRVPSSRVSSERLIFFMDSALTALPDGSTWEVSDHWPSIVLATLAHEYQHMIHFYQKPVLRDTASAIWLNEMASEVAVDLIADKLMVPGPRNVAPHDPTAGEPGNQRGLLPYYNLFNDLQVTAWNSVTANYALNYALGTYLARTYGGAALFSDIVQNANAGIAAIEAALAAAGHDVSFGQVLADWAVATLLSDSTAAPTPYRYNPGSWSTSHAGGERFRIGSINLFNYRYEPPKIVSSCVGPNLASRSALEGPYLHSLRTFNARSQPPHSNMFATLGRNSGSVRLAVTAGTGTLITVVVKE